MARRLALLIALMAYACAVMNRTRSPRPLLNSVASGSSKQFAFLDNYYSYEPTEHHHRSSNDKVIRTKGTKVNTTVTKHPNDKKKRVVKTTTINIESHTNFVIPKRPHRVVISRPITIGAEDFESVDVVEIDYNDISQSVYQPFRQTISHHPPSGTKPLRRPTTPKPHTTSTQRQRTTAINKRPFKTTRPLTTKRPSKTKKTTKRSSTTKRPSMTKRLSAPKLQEINSKRNPSIQNYQLEKTANRLNTMISNCQQPPCASKKSGWISSFFEDNQLKKMPQEKPEKPGWFLGIVKTVYDWIWSGQTSWFGSSWFQNSNEEKSTTLPFMTTTPPAPLTTKGSWFQTLLDSEEEEESADGDKKKSRKKSMKRKYKGYQLLRTYPDTKRKVKDMLDLQEESQGSGIMWWTPPSVQESTDVLVPPDLLEDVKDHLKSNEINYDIMIRDLQNAIKYENPKLSKKQRLELEMSRGHPLTWRRYHRYADILRYLEYLQHSYADIVELMPLGRSSEGLPLVAVKVSLPSNENQTNGEPKGQKKKFKLRSRMKPGVWIEGGAHGREWISPAVTTWILHSLVEGDLGLGDDYEMLNQVDFYIMPVLNPDGYEHSHTHDRLWRKTRSRTSEQTDDYYFGWFPWNWGRTECVGADTDRNWDYKWGEQDSSNDPCAENYAGPHPFSEPETRAVSEFLTENRGQIKVYLSIHAYSQVWLVPSVFGQGNIGEEGEVMEMGKLAAASMADVYGTKYKVGTMADMRQPASGMSHDWASRLGIKYAYHVEMPDVVGQYGYLVPGSQIVATAKETWQAVRTIVDNITP